MCACVQACAAQERTVVSSRRRGYTGCFLQRSPDAVCAAMICVRAGHRRAHRSGISNVVYRAHGHRQQRNSTQLRMGNAQHAYRLHRHRNPRTCCKLCTDRRRWGRLCRVRVPCRNHWCCSPRASADLSVVSKCRPTGWVGVSTGTNQRGTPAHRHTLSGGS